MSLIEDLIALNIQRAGQAPPAPGLAIYTPRVRKPKRWSLPWIKARHDKLFAKHLVRSGERLNRQYWPKRRKAKLNALVEHQAKARRERHAARGCDYRVAGPSGTLSVESHPARLVASMEPGRWYGVRVLERLTGKRKPINWGCSWATRVFLDKAENPRWDESRMIENFGLVIEPKQLWRLNRWGVALRMAILDDLTAERIDLMKLDGAQPDVWRRASQKRRSRGGLSTGDQSGQNIGA